MTTQNKNIPALRFSEFSEDLKESNLGQVAIFTKGKGISKLDVDENGRFECIRYGELYTHYGETIQNIKSKTNLSEKELVFSEQNDVIIPASGETQIDIATASCVLKSGVALGGDLNIIKTKLNGVFLSYYLNNRKKKDIASLAQGSSVVHLYANQLKTLQLNLPTLPEQQKIAAFLTAVDEKIQQLARKKDFLEQYKKGVMQKIFNQEIRFKDAGGNDFADWEEKKIRDFLTESREKGTTGDIAKKLTVKLWGKGVYEKNEKLAGSSNTKYCKRRAGQFIYSKLDFLNCAFGIIPKELDGYESTVDLPCFDISHKLNPTFLLETVKREEFYLKYGMTADGSRKARRIHADIFLDFPIQIPRIEEQNKIAAFLSAIDDKINLAGRQLEKTKEYKKGLLQQMFV